MKYYFIIIIVVLATLLSGQQAHYRLINTKNAIQLSLEEMAEELQSYRVIFFGEFHENEILHKLEFELLMELYKKDQDLAVSMEMFERDVQPIIDNYLQGKVTEAEFLAGSRPWPNYERDYRPIIEFAKDNELSVIAANIPRRYAAAIHKNGLQALDSLNIVEKEFIASEHKVLDDEYKSRFITTMQKNMAHDPRSPMAMNMNFDLLYAAQCIKDDTMAESLQQHSIYFPNNRIIHYNGDFHSRKHLGTAQKLELLMPEIETAVIAPLILRKGENYTAKDLQEADYLILIVNE